jgi:putative flippase GtrA
MSILFTWHKAREFFAVAVHTIIRHRATPPHRKKLELQMTAPVTGKVRRSTFLTRAWSGLLSNIVKFGIVGGLGFVLDVAIFNMLRLGVLGAEQWWSTALGAKVVSTSLTIIFNWLGNRFWTFRNGRHTHITLEFFEFVIASPLGMAVSLACLWITHHILGLTSIWADNISGNVIGLGLGTMLRFVLYQFWVWNPRRAKTEKTS